MTIQSGSDGKAVFCCGYSQLAKDDPEAVELLKSDTTGWQAKNLSVTCCVAERRAQSVVESAVIVVDDSVSCAFDSKSVYIGRRGQR